MNCEITYEELSAYGSGDLEPERTRILQDHLARCTRCRGRMAALQTGDSALRALTAQPPPVRALGNAWSRIAAEIARDRGHEIMTLEEVAAFLRIAPQDLDSVIDELPAFELAGYIRVRRTRLLQWIEERERRHARHIAESELARALSAALPKRTKALGIG